jgi:hypothetical protein
MVRDREKLSSGLDSASQKSINLTKIFKKVLKTVKMQACVIKRLLHVSVTLAFFRNAL